MADSMEVIAEANVKLLSEYKYLLESRNLYKARSEKQERVIAGLRGHIKRIKKQLSND
jgi:hypothetical protein